MKRKRLVRTYIWRSLMSFQSKTLHQGQEIKCILCLFKWHAKEWPSDRLVGVFFRYRAKAKYFLSVIILVFQQDVDALGTLNVQPTVVKVKTHVPYYNLKVIPQCNIKENWLFLKFVWEYETQTICEVRFETKQTVVRWLSIRGTQRLFPAKYLFREVDIV